MKSSGFRSKEDYWLQSEGTQNIVFIWQEKLTLNKIVYGLTNHLLKETYIATRSSGCKWGSPSVPVTKDTPDTVLMMYRAPQHKTGGLNDPIASVPIPPAPLSSSHA